MPVKPSSRVGAVAVIGALFIVGLMGSRFVDAQAAPAAQVTLRLWPAGQGRIEVTQGGSDLDPNPCGFTAILEKGAASPCLVTVTVGVPVTLKAVEEPNATVPAGAETDVPDFPVQHPTFVRWSRSDCGSAASCTFTPESDSDGDWITALFSPLQLQVGVFGSGDVTFRRSDGVVVQPDCPQAVGFGDRTCHAAVPADLDVVIETSPNPTAWGLGCEPEGGSATSPRCGLTMSNLRTLAFVSFDGQEPLDPPFRLTPRVKVKLGGSGNGIVKGTGIECPSTCQIDVDYQSRVELTAEKAAGSTFVRWVGVCGTTTTCVFRAGSATQVQAVFDATPAPTTTTTTTTTTPTSTTPTSTPTGPPTTTTTTTAPTTARTTTPRPRPPRLVDVAVRGRGAKRVVTFAVIIERRGLATARLLRQRSTIVSRTIALARGRNARRLQVPRTAQPGDYRLSLRVVAGRGVQTLTARVRIPR
jgi:hypothetical protein